MRNRFYMDVTKALTVVLTLLFWVGGAFALPDLTVTSVRGPATGLKNQYVSASCEVKNTGDKKSGSFKYSIYLSSHMSSTGISTTVLTTSL